MLYDISSGKSAQYLLSSSTDPGSPSPSLLLQAQHGASGSVIHSVLPLHSGAMADEML